MEASAWDRTRIFILWDGNMKRETFGLCRFSEVVISKMLESQRVHVSGWEQIVWKNGRGPK